MHPPKMRRTLHWSIIIPKPCSIFSSVFLLAFKEVTAIMRRKEISCSIARQATNYICSTSQDKTAINGTIFNKRAFLLLLLYSILRVPYLCYTHTKHKSRKGLAVFFFFFILADLIHISRKSFLVWLSRMNTRYVFFLPLFCSLNPLTSFYCLLYQLFRHHQGRIHGQRVLT